VLAGERNQGSGALLTRPSNPPRLPPRPKVHRPALRVPVIQRVSAGEKVLDGFALIKVESHHESGRRDLKR